MEILAICTGGWSGGSRSEKTYKFDHIIQGLVRKPEWDLPTGMSGWIRVSADRLFFISGGNVWEFVEEPTDGVHWKNLPGVGGSGEPIAVQLSYLA